MADITYKLEKVSFDGPLDLLLTLIEKNKVDIYDIPIAEITDQYLEYVRSMEGIPLEEMSDFLVMAASLLSIKARMLLPKEEPEEEEEIDPREELVERLLLYKRARYSAEELEKREDYADGFFYKEESLPEEVRTYVAPLDMDALLAGVDAERLRAVFEEVIHRREFRRDTSRESFGVIKRERVPLRTKITSVLRYAIERRSFSFREMLLEAHSRTEVVVSFLAVLELMKAGAVRAEQTPDGKDMTVTASEDIDTLSIDLNELVDE